MKNGAGPRCRTGTVARFTLCLLLINLIWRTVRYALGFPIWGDEAFVVMNFVNRDFIGMISPLEYGQIVPLGFMWAELAVTRILGLSEWALRLLPYLAGVLSMLLFWQFAEKYFNRWIALLAVALFAASYYPVRHATEVKPYSIDLFVSLVMIYLSWAVYQQPYQKKRWILLIVIAVVSIWLSYPSVFVMGGVGLLLTYLVVSRKEAKFVGWWIAYGLCIIASFATMYFLYAKPHAAAAWPGDAPWTIEEWGAGFPPVKEPWKLPIWILDVHTGNMLAYPVGGVKGGSSLTSLLVLIGIVSLWRTSREMLLLLLGPLLFTFIAAAMHSYPYGTSARFSLYMAPAFCLLAGIGLINVIKTLRPPRKIFRCARVTVIVMALIAIGGIIRDVMQPYKSLSDYENRRVIQWLAQQTRPSDQWISFNAANPKLTYVDNLYRRGGSGARHRYYLHRLAPVPLHWAPDPMEVASTPGSQIWLIVFKDDRVPFPEDLLDNYVQRLIKRLGEPRQHAFPLHHKRYAMEIEIYEFSGFQ
ncbi:MAG: glycosyltransferase family 39 protein [Planctomycetota bacterium]|nr:MAG: glycosyltransferase family 39 protein [Planctomycetota bacterium]